MYEDNDRRSDASPYRYSPETPADSPAPEESHAEENTAEATSRPVRETPSSDSTYHQTYRDNPYASETYRPAAPRRYEEPERPPYRSYREDAYPEEPRKPKKAKKGWTAGRIIALALVCALLGGACGLGGSYLMLSQKQKKAEEEAKTESGVILQGSRPTMNLETASVDTGEKLTASQVYAANVNSTVGITTSITTNYWGFQTTSAASGSGFILTEDGYVLTNYHVIEDSSSVKVATYDGKSYSAVVVGCDTDNDIAVLKIEADGLVPVVLGSSDSLTVGEDVVAIGNPLGELTFSLTSGVVSALDRTVTFSDGTSMKLIQTDCAINSGNSGGALFNLYGEVVGITNAKYGSSSSSSIDNIGFAIPIDTVRSIVESIIEKGMIVRPYIGVSCGTVSTEMQSYGFPKGAVLKELTADAPAAQAGLQVNDIVTAINGKAIASSSDLVDTIAELTPGDTASFTVYRQGEDDLLNISVTIGEQQESAVVTTQSDTQQQQQQQQQSQNSNPYYYYSNPFSYFGK